MAEVIDQLFRIDLNFRPQSVVRKPLHCLDLLFNRWTEVANVAAALLTSKPVIDLQHLTALFLKIERQRFTNTRDFMLPKFRAFVIYPQRCMRPGKVHRVLAVLGGLL